MQHLKRNIALFASTAVLGTVGIGGVMAAHADPTHHPAHSSTVQKSEGTEVTETNDGADQGPDANPNEAGHQDANETGESDNGTEGPEGTEAAEGAETNDGADQGPDANPNEAGHQDANKTGES